MEMDVERIRKMDALWGVCEAFVQRNQIHCAEATVEDRVYENAPELVEQIANIVGFYKYPDDEPQS
jgi:hypothetical protein